MTETLGERLVERLSITQAMLDDNEQLRAENARLREAIRRLADQDATLSVCDGAVTVTMDATADTHATPSERSVQGEGTLSEPLYRHPLCQDSSQKNCTLTDAEREAVEVAAAAYAEDHGERFAAILRHLLGRLPA